MPGVPDFAYIGTVRGMADEDLIQTLLRTLDGAPRAIGAFFESARPLPEEDSVASAERNGADGDRFNLEMLAYVQERSWMSARGAGESVRGVGRLLWSWPLMFMPGPVIRAGIESSGLVCWMLAGGLSVERRIQRAIAVRKQDVDEERRISGAGARAARGEHKAILEDAVDWAAEQQENFLTRASRAGLRGVRVPTDMDLAELCDAGYEYRLATLVAHGRPLAYRAVEAMFKSQSPTEHSSGGNLP